MPQFPRDGPLGRDPDRSRDSDTPPPPPPAASLGRGDGWMESFP